MGLNLSPTQQAYIDYSANFNPTPFNSDRLTYDQWLAQQQTAAPGLLGTTTTAQPAPLGTTTTSQPTTTSTSTTASAQPRWDWYNTGMDDGTGKPLQAWVQYGADGQPILNQNNTLIGAATGQQPVSQTNVSSFGDVAGPTAATQPATTSAATAQPTSSTTTTQPAASTTTTQPTSGTSTGLIGGTAGATTTSPTTPTWDATITSADGRVTDGFTFLKRNADGSIDWKRSDGSVFNSVTKDQAAQYGLSKEQLDKWYTTGVQSPLPGDWDIQITSPDGKQTDGFRFLGLNPDGTANWQRSDGIVFNNISYEQARSFGAPENIIEYYRKAAQATANTANVSTWDVDPNQTVQGQFNGLIDSGNPLIQKARTNALQQMNRRGLLNSSMAIGAADSAAYDAALPIAQADANTYAQAASANMTAQNQIGMFNAGVQNTTSQFNAAAANQLQIQNMNQQAAINMKKLDASLQQQLSEFQTKNQAMLQSNQYAASMWSNMVSRIAEIQAMPGVDATTKSTMIANMINATSDGLYMLQTVGNINFGTFLDGMDAWAGQV